MQAGVLYREQQLTTALGRRSIWWVPHEHADPGRADGLFPCPPEDRIQRIDPTGSQIGVASSRRPFGTLSDGVYDTPGVHIRLELADQGDEPCNVRRGE